MRKQIHNTIGSNALMKARGALIDEVKEFLSQHMKKSPEIVSQPSGMLISDSQLKVAKPSMYYFSEKMPAPSA